MSEYEPAVLIGGPHPYPTRIAVSRTSEKFVIRRGTFVPLNGERFPPSIVQHHDTRVGHYRRLRGIRPAVFLWQGWER